MKPPLRTLRETSRGNVKFQTTLDPTNEVFHRPGQGIYSWTYANTYHALSDEEFESGRYPIKFGQYGAEAAGGKLPQDTIEEYVGTTIDAIVILSVHRLSDEQIADIGNSKFIEKKVGTVKNLGPKSEVGSSTEVFQTNLKTIRNCVNEVLYPQAQHGILTRPNTFQARYRQQECIDKFYKYYTENVDKQSIDFLIAAVPRFGKNFSALEITRKVIPHNGNILVLTSRPDVFESLKTDVNTHVNYVGYVYTELKDLKYKFTPSTTQVNVLAVSTQLLKHKKHHKKLTKYLSQYSWDIRIIDEADTGMLTERSSRILDELPSLVSVWMSGTPWKVIESGRFNKHNIYNYDYVQQQKDKKAGLDLRAVTIDFYIMDILDNIKSQKKWYTDDEGFTLTKLFAWNAATGRFIHEADVELFLKSIFGIIPKTNFSPYKIIPELKHTFWVLPPNSDAIIRLKYLIEKITNNDIKVFAATGNEVDDISEIKDFLRWAGDKKSVVLSINRFTRGTTVPEWDAVFMLNDTESPEHYFQSGFRCSTPNTGKDKGYVFDFSGNRNLVMIGEYARLAAAHLGITNPIEFSKEFIDNFNVLACDGGVEFKLKEVADIVAAMRTSDYTANTLRNSGNSYINVKNISDSLRGAIMGLSKESIERLTIEISSAGDLMKKGKNYKISPVEQTKNSENSVRKNSENSVRDVVARIATMMSRLPIICTLPEYNTVEDIIEHMPEDEFYGATRTKKEILAKLVEEGVLDTYKVNLQLA
jgi:hypothetical protein